MLMLQNKISWIKTMQILPKQFWWFKADLILINNGNASKQFRWFETVLTKQYWSFMVWYCVRRKWSKIWMLNTLCITMTFMAYSKCDVPSVDISLINHKLFCTQKCQKYYSHLQDICYSLTLKPHVPPGPAFVKAKAVALTLIN